MNISTLKDYALNFTKGLQFPQDDTYYNNINTYHTNLLHNLFKYLPKEYTGGSDLIPYRDINLPMYTPSGSVGSSL